MPKDTMTMKHGLIRNEDVDVAPKVLIEDRPLLVSSMITKSPEEFAETNHPLIDKLSLLKRIIDRWDEWIDSHTKRQASSPQSRYRLAVDFAVDGAVLYTDDLDPLCVVRPLGDNIVGYTPWQKRDCSLARKYFEVLEIEASELSEAIVLKQILGPAAFQDIQDFHRVKDYCDHVVARHPKSATTFARIDNSGINPVTGIIYVNGHKYETVTAAGNNFTITSHE